MLSDLFEPLAGDAPAACDVLQERHDVVRAFRSAEGEQEEGVIGGGGWLIRHTSDPATPH